MGFLASQGPPEFKAAQATSPAIAANVTPRARTKKSGAIFSLRPVSPVSLLAVRGKPMHTIATTAVIRATAKRAMISFTITELCG